MKLFEVKYGDFVVWTTNELVVLRMDRDELFLREAMDRATEFFKYSVLPELMGKWYTRPPSASTQLLSPDPQLLVQRSLESCKCC